MPFNKNRNKDSYYAKQELLRCRPQAGAGSEVLITALVSLNDGRASHTTTDAQSSKTSLCVSLLHLM